MKKMLIGVLVIASGAMVAVRAWPEKKPAPSTVPSQEAASVDISPVAASEIDTELRSLRREVAQVRLAQQASVAATAAPTPPAAAEQTRPPPEELREKRRAIIARVAQGYVRQPRDDAWAISTEHAIGDVMRTNATDSRVLNVACATTLCRVVVESDNEEAQHALGGAIASEDPFAAGVLYDHSGLTTTMYVRRATDVAF